MDDNEERISAAERKAQIDEMAQRAGFEIALEGAIQRHRGYRQGIYDGFFFAFFLVISVCLIYARYQDGTA